MERLTLERGERTWKLFRIGWYVNLACFGVVMYGALYFMYLLASGVSEASEAATFDTVIMVGLFLLAGLLLVGASVTRYQARLEGQHLELKLAINRINEALEALRKTKEIS